MSRKSKFLVGHSLKEYLKNMSLNRNCHECGWYWDLSSMEDQEVNPDSFMCGKTKIVYRLKKNVASLDSGATVKAGSQHFVKTPAMFDRMLPFDINTDHNYCPDFKPKKNGVRKVLKVLEEKE